MISSLAYCDGFVYSKTSGTTPSPPQMAEYLGELVANGCEAAVIESSSEGIAERRLSGLEFDACVYTNVKKDHLDSHGTLKNYRKIKTRLLGRLKPDGFAVLNADDKFLGKWIDNIHCPTLTYGTRNHAEIQAERIEQTVFGQTFLIFAGNESIPVKTPVVGDFFIRHCLAAVTVGLAFGLELEDVVRGIESVERIPGRMERLSSQHPSSIFIDAAKTPSQLHGMLRTLNSLPQEGKTWCIFGGASGVSKEQLAGLGTVAERHADHTIISGVDVHNESALEIAHEILDGYEDVAKAHIIPNRAAAIEHVLDNAAAGDKILIEVLSEIIYSNDFDSLLRFYDTDGTTVMFENDDLEVNSSGVNNGGPYSMDAMLWNLPVDAAGRYFIEVDSFGSGDSGNYDMVVAVARFQAIPEPSAILFLSAVLGSAAMRRRRRSSSC